MYSILILVNFFPAKPFTYTHTYIHIKYNQKSMIKNKYSKKNDLHSIHQHIYVQHLNCLIGREFRIKFLTHILEFKHLFN